MTTTAAFLFPGQGSQYVGMGKSLFEAYPAVRRMFEEASDVAGRDFRQLCFEGPEATLVKTANVQPAITLVNLAVAEVLREEGVEPVAAAGHSLGEYSALCAAGALSFTDTIRLVQARGTAMQQAADANPGGMIAVFGLDGDRLRSIVSDLGDLPVDVANYNSPLQIALTGTHDALQRVSAEAKTRGAKLVVPLKVSGAWHSRFMAAAQEPLRQALEACPLTAPRFPVVANITGRPYGDEPHVVRQMLVDQIVSPVRWMHSMTRLIEEGHRLFVEAGPGRVLSGLLRDVSREAKSFSVQDVDSLAKLRAALPAVSGG